MAQVAPLARDFELVVIFTSNASFAADLATVTRLKEENPELVVGLVGPQVSILPEESLAAGPQLDFVARREFDYTILEMAQGQPWERNSGGELPAERQHPSQPRPALHRGPGRPALGHRRLPPGPDASKITRSLICAIPTSPFIPAGAAPTAASTACGPRPSPGGATGCGAWPTWWPKCAGPWSISPRPPRSSLTTIPSPPTGSGPGRWAGNSAPLKFLWSTTGRVNTTYETLKAMKEGGLRLLVVGFEIRGRPDPEKHKKGTTLELGRRFMRWCKELGITVHGTFMVGLPGETPASLEASIRFACELDPDTIQVSLATPYPGTEFYDFCREKGYMADEALVHGATGYQQCVVDYPGLSSEDIFKAVPRFYRRFYFRPQALARITWSMVKDPVERKRFLQQGQEFLTFLFRRRQGKGDAGSIGSSCP